MEWNYIIHYEVAAMLITVIVALHFFLKKTINTRATGLFSLLIISSLIANGVHLFTIILKMYTNGMSFILDTILRQIYLVSVLAIPAIFLAYMICATSWEEPLEARELGIIFVPIVLVTGVILLNPVHGWMFYYTKDGAYHSGRGIILLYLVAVLYMVFTFAFGIRYRRKMIMIQEVTVIFYSISGLGAMLVQLFVPRMMLVQFAIAISILMMYLSLEDPQDYMDKQLGTHNHIAFMHMFQANVRREKAFHVLAIQIEGMKYINDFLGVTIGNELMKEIAEYLLEISGKQKVYHMSGAQFVIMGISPLEEWTELLEVVHERFRQPFIAGKMEIALSASMCMMTYPDTVERLEDAIDMIEYSLNKAKASGEELVVYADKEILEKGKREALLLQLIRNAIREESFDVYYQPIFSVEQQRYTTAEALVRLHTKELGFVSPEEFIPIAEKNGLVIEIDDLVFKKVCRFFTENQLQEKGIEYIHVNLSVIECMQEKLCEKLLHTMDEFGLDYHYIQFEITETAAVASKEVLKNTMEKLIKHGIEFAMDDYGTGFSNTATIINYPFSTIKLDKSMIWSAMEDEKAMIALKHMISMSKELKLHIIAEGVETLAQANHLAVLGCDYFQGYYFSRPLDQEDFLKVLSKKIKFL